MSKIIAASFDEVLLELKTLEKRLEQSNLSQLTTFNTAYYIVTEAVKDAAAAGYFENPLFVEEFTVQFAGYYFDAVSDMSSRSQKLPTAWAKMNDASHMNIVPKFTTLLMGANAHINHDLPLALADFMSKSQTYYSLRDVRKVDKVLLKSGRQIIGAFDEPTKRLNTLKHRLRFLYYRPVMYMILYWRIIAWRNYRLIKRNGSAQFSHEKRSTRIAGRLFKLGRIISWVVG